MSRHAHEVEKFCMFFDSIEIAQAALVRFRAFPGIEAVQGAPDNVEVTAAGVDKGTALLALADRLGIPREATLAIGDSDNDAENAPARVACRSRWATQTQRSRIWQKYITRRL